MLTTARLAIFVLLLFVVLTPAFATPIQSCTDGQEFPASDLSLKTQTGFNYPIGTEFQPDWLAASLANCKEEQYRARLVIVKANKKVISEPRTLELLGMGISAIAICWRKNK
ncbi:MAG: hypothetical protein WC768_05130 [Patescibacteria group bacterium]